MRAVLCTFLLVSFLFGSAQQYIWARNYIKTNQVIDGITAMATDTNGNVYVAGDFTGGVSIGGDTAISQINTQYQSYEQNCFIVKTGPNAQTDWLRTINNQLVYSISDIQVDAGGNTYFAGSYSEDSTAPDNGFYWYAGGRVIMLNPNGNTQTILTLHAPGFSDESEVQIKRIAIRDSFLYVAGLTNDTIMFGDSIFTVEGIAAGYYFIAKYNLNNDQFAWKRLITGTGSVYSLDPLVIGNDGGIVLSGTIGGYIDGEYTWPDTSYFDSQTIVAPPAIQEGFVAELNSNGKYKWAWASDSLNWEQGSGAAIDNRGNVYFGMQSGYAVKFDTGGQIIWSKQLSQSGWGTFGGLGNALYASGGNNRSDSVYETPDTTVLNVWSDYVVRLDTNGELVWCAPYGKSSIGTAKITNLAIGNNGAIYLAGNFNGSCNIGNSKLIDNSYYDYTLALICDKQNNSNDSVIIQGRVYFDNNNNCVFDSGDSAARNYGVIVTPGNYITYSDSTGAYSLNVPSGIYTIQEILPEQDAGNLSQTCPIGLQYATGVLNSGDIDSSNNFGNQLSWCSVTTGILNITSAQCNSQFNTVLQICNYGQHLIDSDMVRISIPATTNIIMLGVNPLFNYLDTQTNELVFINLPVSPDSCTDITISDSFDCNMPPQDYYNLQYRYTSSILVSGVCQNPDYSLNLDTAYAGIIVPVNILETQNYSKFSVYPNPNNGTFRIENNGAVAGDEVFLADMSGRKVWNQHIESSKEMISANNLASGVYVLTVVYQSRVLGREKIIVQ